MTPASTSSGAEGAAPQRIQLNLARGAARCAHLRLAERLARLPGVVLAIKWCAVTDALPGSAALLFNLERLIHGLQPFDLVAVLPEAAFAAFGPSGAPDLVIDLAGDTAAPVGAATWTVTFDGHIGEGALLAALLAKRAPVVDIRQNGRMVSSGRIGTEYQGIAGAAFNDSLARIITLIEATVRGVRPDLPDRDATPFADAPRRFKLDPIATARMLARGIVARLYRLCFHSPQWRVGWRVVGVDGDVFDLRRHPDSGWKTLEDDGLRFYADPFPIDVDGKTYLFVEDYLHSKGKGIIAAAAFDASGPLGPFVPVLETADHLSYPFVFAQDGEFWMIPESNGAGTIDLYRATRFPGGWEKEATLVSGVAASDATLVMHDGRWWMFATVRDGGGSFSDALYLWSASDFRGPFTPHKRNPVLVDVASARPAGRMVARDGKLWRPVQDCRRRYGGGLALAVVDRLDDEGFEQHVDSSLEAGSALWPGNRLHTLNRTGSLEFIDGSGKPPRRF